MVTDQLADQLQEKQCNFAMLVFTFPLFLHLRSPCQSSSCRDFSPPAAYALTCHAKVMPLTVEPEEEPLPLLDSAIVPNAQCQKSRVDFDNSPGVGKKNGILHYLTIFENAVS